MFRKKLLLARYGVKDMDESAKRIQKLLLEHQRTIFLYYLHIMDPQALVLIQMIYVERIGNLRVMVIMVTQI